MFSKLVDFVKGDKDIPQIDTHWFSESGIIDVFMMLGPKPADVFKQYAKLTGTTPLPPVSQSFHFFLVYMEYFFILALFCVPILIEFYR